MENKEKAKLCSKNGKAEEDEKLLMPYNHILNVPGKKIRSQITKAFNYWLQVPEDKLQEIDNIIHTVHNIGLLFDDIEDNSLLRRGIPVAHSIYGIPLTVNASNYALMIVIQSSLSLNHPEAVNVIIEELLDLHRGQGMDIYWRDNYLCPTEEEYMEMTRKKTGALFILAIRLMQLFSKNQQDFTTLAGILGTYFQIQDDYINLRSDTYMTNKSFCEDLTEGKFSFPLIHAINATGSTNEVMNIIKQRTQNVEVKTYCVQLLEKLGSFQYTRETLAKLDVTAKAEIQKLGSNALLEEFVNTVLKMYSRV